METQSDGKDELQPLRGTLVPADSVEFMESGTKGVLHVHLQKPSV